MDFKLSNLSKDIPAGIGVFLVALPLCLGVALASGAPLFSGIIAGVIGGVVVGAISGSSLGVSGPAAGLAMIVSTAIQGASTFEVFLLSVVLAGVFQILMALIGAGKISYYFPSSVIKGMLSAIGIIIILKQLPHAFGLDRDEEGDFSFLQHDGENTFSELLKISDYTQEGALIIGVVSLLFLILWDKFVKKSSFLGKIPSALICVIIGLAINHFLPHNLILGSEHLVKLPVASSTNEFLSFFKHPNFSAITTFSVWKTALILGIVASLETLLSVEATDRLDPENRITPKNKELIAQGVGNIFSGLIGGIPVTQVIVRSSANIQFGGKSKFSTIIHGLILLVSVVFIPKILNMIPLATLAAILIMVGYKLASPSVFKFMYKEGVNQFIPFLITLVTIIFTDLLTGILVGLVVGFGYVLFNNFKNSISITTQGATKLIKFNKDIFFFNRAELINKLASLKENETVYIDGTNSNFIDYDIYQTIKEFADEKKNMNIELQGININKTK